MKRFVWLVLALSLACGAKKSTSTSQPNLQRTVTESIRLAQQKALAAESASRKQMEKLAQDGIAASQECLARAPEEAGCYYWRAVNTGLYYQAHVLGYQTGVKQMLSDAEKVIQLQPSYANAGAYRLLGQLYTELPQTSSRAENIVQDLSKAEQYLKQAIQLAPQYPENHLALAANLLKQERFTEAKTELLNAKNLVPQWKRDHSYASWLVSTKKLEGELAKKN